MTNMKTNPMLSLAALVAAASLLTGCGEQPAAQAPAPATPPPSPAPSAPAVPATPPIAPPAPKPTEPAKPQVAAPAPPKPAEPPKTVVQEAAKVATQLATDAGNAAQKQFLDLVTEVKQLVADGKSSEALAKLQTALANLKLTPEQQTLVDSIKKQAQEAISQKGVEAASKALGDLFKPKPATPAAAPTAPAAPVPQK